MVDVRMLPAGEDNEAITVTLDELAREGARGTIAMALEAERSLTTSSGSLISATRTASGWWSATGARGSAR
jgi:hypothetical protein